MSKFPELYIDDDGIFHEYHYDQIINRSCAMFVANERNRLSDIKRPLLVQFEDLRGYSNDTRDMSLDVILKSVSALAYAVDMTTEAGKRTREFIETWFFITPWPIPVKIFDDEAEALAWLKTYLEN